MTQYQKHKIWVAPLAALALLAVSTVPAMAGSGLKPAAPKVHFPYSASLTAEENYATFRKVARKHCKKIDDVSYRRPLSSTLNLRRECERDILNDVVAETGSSQMLALHQSPGQPGHPQYVDSGQIKTN